MERTLRKFFEDNGIVSLRIDLPFREGEATDRQLMYRWEFNDRHRFAWSRQTLNAANGTAHDSLEDAFAELEVLAEKDRRVAAFEDEIRDRSNVFYAALEREDRA